MTRLLFPLDRTVFLYTGPGEPIRQPWDSQVTLYTSSALTTLANVIDEDLGSLPGSVIFIGDDGLLPNFYGPDNVAVLWAKPVEGAAYPLVAKMAEYVAFILDGLLLEGGEALPTAGAIIAIEFDEITGWPDRPDLPEGVKGLWINRYTEEQPPAGLGGYLPFVDLALISLPLEEE